MAKSENQRLKMLYIKKILEQETDSEHHITVPELIDKLEAEGISAERKSIYSDIGLLIDFGMDIEIVHGKSNEYYLASREFELPEMKLLVDSVQVSKFLTVKKSDSLIKKLESMCSRYEAGQLQRQVYVANRIKTMNESIYYNIDAIHDAISRNRMILFRYFSYDLKKQRVWRKDGGKYNVSPFSLVQNDENYYLIAYDADDKKIKHFRVDKMADIELTGNERIGKEQFSEDDTATYSARVFSMFGGEQVSVKMWFAESMIGVVIDRFGKDITVIPSDSGFIIRAEIAVSPQFFGWIFSLGKNAKILSPDSVVEKYNQQLQDVIAAMGN